MQICASGTLLRLHGLGHCLRRSHPEDARSLLAMRTLTRCCLLILHSILRTDYLGHYRETRDQMRQIGNKEVLRPRCMLSISILVVLLDRQL
jgi:hypothetical protein